MTRVVDTPGFAVYPSPRVTGGGRYRPLPRHATATDGPAEEYGLPPDLPEPLSASHIRPEPPADPPMPGAWLDEDPAPAAVAVDLHGTRWRWWTKPTRQEAHRG